MCIDSFAGEPARGGVQEPAEKFEVQAERGGEASPLRGEVRQVVLGRARSAGRYEADICTKDYISYYIQSYVAVCVCVYFVGFRAAAQGEGKNQVHRRRLGLDVRRAHQLLNECILTRKRARKSALLSFSLLLYPRRRRRRRYFWATGVRSLT